jgi:hypothetical protein
MKKEASIILLLLVAFVFADVVSAVSITPAVVRYDFVPNKVDTFQFTVDRAASIDVMLEYDDNPSLTQYVTLVDPAPKTGPRTVSVIVRLPESLSTPGPNRIYVKAQEIASEGNAAAAIRAPIIINVPYPSYYLTTELGVPIVNQGEIADICLMVVNKGSSNVYQAYARVDVYNADKSTIMTSMVTEVKEIDVGQTVLFDAYLPTADIRPGSYRVVTTFYYEGGSDVKEGVLNVGTQSLEIGDYTTQLEQGKIDRFVMRVQSKSNTLLENVYAKVFLEGVEVMTPSYTLAPSEIKEMVAYIDTTNMAFSYHNGTLTVYYAGKSTSQDIRVSVGTPSEPAPTIPPGNTQGNGNGNPGGNVPGEEINIPMVVTVSDHNSFNLNTDTINFGKMTSPGEASTGFILANSADYKRRACLFVSGELMSWMVSPIGYSYILDAYERKESVISISIPANVAMKGYYGNLRVVYSNVTGWADETNPNACDKYDNNGGNNQGEEDNQQGNNQGNGNNGQGNGNSGGENAPTVPSPTCSGCVSGDRCLPYGTRMKNAEKDVYCDISGEFKSQMPDNADCQNNYECISNYCSDRKCVNLQAQLQENRNILQEILDWLKNLFGVGKK